MIDFEAITTLRRFKAIWDEQKVYCYELSIENHRFKLKRTEIPEGNICL